MSRKNIRGPVFLLAATLLWPLPVTAEDKPATSPKAKLVAPTTIRFEVTRPTPWSPGSGNALFNVTEISGEADASPLSVLMDPLVEKDTNRQFNASGKVSFASSDLTIGRRLTKAGSIQIEKANETGLATSKLTLRSPSLSEPVLVNIEVVVRDDWEWALLAVFLGTWLSYWSLRWKSSGRQLLLDKIKAEKLENEARNLEPKLPDDKKQELQTVVYKALREARYAIEIENESEAKKWLDQAATKLEELAKAKHGPALAIRFLSGHNLKILVRGPLDTFRSLFNAPTDDLLLRRLKLYDRARLSLVIFIVTLLGFETVYKNQPFGGWDYITAFIYGFGIDRTVKGIGQVADKI